ncbi:MAG: thioredoxin family protein [Puniceicoccales bacterium]|nr:thioredoxin family protein [Puniceicoccales bacterium]
MRFFHLFILTLSVFSPALLLSAKPSAQTEVTILADHAAVSPGQTLYLGLHLVSRPGWHTYWKNPGESGFPASIEWKSTTQAKTGDWLWPAPKEFVQGGIRSAIIENDAIILIPLSVAPDVKSGESVTLSGTLSWLECNETTCVPQEAALTLTLPVQSAAIPANTALFTKAHAAIYHDTPQDTAPPNTPKAAEPAGHGGALVWEDWSPEHQQTLLDAGRLVYVDFTARWCVTCQVNKRIYNDSAVAAALRQHNVALLRADWTKKNPLIAAELAKYKRAAVPFNVFLQKGRAPVALSEVLTAAHMLERLDSALGKHPADAPTPAPSSGTLPLQLASGFLGGLLLNLMPCVFPVLGMKIMHFAAQAGNSRRKTAAHGLVFTSGVVLSFWVLAALLRVLRGGGETLGWGFQLQEPRFVFVLTVLLLVFALNMTGLFEVGGRAVGAGESLRAKSGLPGAFFSGVLSTVVATPCSAPFLGVALGAALTLPPVESWALFTAIALGLSTPCLVLAAAPGLIRILPRPGAWMESFKQGLSFLLFGSVAYLVWVLATQLEAGLLQVLFSLVLIAFACWIYGRWTPPHRSTRARRIGGILATALFLCACAWGFYAGF